MKFFLKNSVFIEKKCPHFLPSCKHHNFNIYFCYNKFAFIWEAVSTISVDGFSFDPFLICSDVFWLRLGHFLTHRGFPHISVGKESACNAGDPSSIPGSGRSTGEEISLPIPVFLGFPDGSTTKESACNAKTWVHSLGWEDPLEKGKAIHSSILTGQFHGLYSSQDRKQWGMTEWLSLHFTSPVEATSFNFYMQSHPLNGSLWCYPHRSSELTSLGSQCLP